LATDAETQTGTDTTRAVTPAGAAATYVPLADYIAKGDILAATAANTPTALAVGTDGQVLTACTACTTGLVWSSAAASSSIPCACITGKGALVSGTAASTPTALPVGTDGQVLVADSACTSGLMWQTGTVGPWISAGTIQSVGWNSTGGVAVSPTTTTQNSVSYRQLGPKEWQVVYMFISTGSFTSAGSNDWLFTLPNGLQFNTTLPFQTAWTSNIATGSVNNGLNILPGQVSSYMAFTNGGNGSVFGAGPAIWDATQFRFMVTDTTASNPRALGSNYYGNANSVIAFRINLQFTSL